MVEIATKIAIFETGCEVGKDRRDGPHLGDSVKFDIAKVGIRKDKGRRKRAEDDIAQLDAAGRDDITKGEVIFAQEVWEIVQQNQ